MLPSEEPTSEGTYPMAFPTAHDYTKSSIKYLHKTLETKLLTNGLLGNTQRGCLLLSKPYHQDLNDFMVYFNTKWFNFKGIMLHVEINYLNNVLDMTEVHQM